MPFQSITLRLEPELYKEIADFADRLGITKSEYIRHAIQSQGTYMRANPDAQVTRTKLDAAVVLPPLTPTTRKRSKPQTKKPDPNEAVALPEDPPPGPPELHELWYALKAAEGTEDEARARQVYNSAHFAWSNRQEALAKQPPPPKPPLPYCPEIANFKATEAAHIAQMKAGMPPEAPVLLFSPAQMPPIY